MRVEVLYALPSRTWRRVVELAGDATVADAITASGVLAENSGIDLRRHQVGVFGKAVTLARTLRDGDRVEIYRGLRVEPKEARRGRAAAKRA